MYQREKSMVIETVSNKDPNVFWDYIKRLGPRRKECIPMEMYNDDGTINCNKHEVMKYWKDSFDDLFNRGVGMKRDKDFDRHVSDYMVMMENNMVDPLYQTDVKLNKNITEDEVVKIIQKLKNKKAMGIDMVPNEIIKCKVIVPMLVTLFNLCFDTGIVPQQWYQSIVHPIHKSSETDPRIPTHYRGISLVSCVYKVFTAVLGHRVSYFYEDKDILVEEQGGFRKGRSCVDQAFILHGLAKNAISKNDDLYACFIDLRKAFDCVCRDMLMYKLLVTGINGKMYFILKSLYDGQKTQSSIRVNNQLTDWFLTGLGVKQEDSLSPVLFLMFVNDLAVELKNMNIGCKLGDKKLPILLYADDIVLLSNDTDELQLMLNHVYEWCNKWLMSVNLDKTNIMHFRKNEKARNMYEFKYGDQSIEYTDCYKYLGLYFDEHLNMDTNEDKLSAAGKKALGSIINKLRMNENMTYECFSKCVTSCVYPVVEYGSEITGIYKNVKLDRVIDSAARAYLGVHRFCPIVSMYKDLG